MEVGWPLALGQLRHLSLIDPMGIGDHPAASRLAEHLGQPHHRYCAGPDDIAQHLARPDRGKLVDVADEQQPRPLRHRPQQRAHQQHVHHAGLVHHQQLAIHAIGMRCLARWRP